MDLSWGNHFVVFFSCLWRPFCLPDSGRRGVPGLLVAALALELQRLPAEGGQQDVGDDGGRRGERQREKDKHHCQKGSLMGAHLTTCLVGGGWNQILWPRWIRG